MTIMSFGLAAVRDKIKKNQIINPFKSARGTDMSQHFSFCKILASCFLALAISTVTGAQTPSAKSAGGDAKPSSPQNGKPADRPEAVLTAAQLAKIKSVLAPYKPASLSADDAKLIKRTLRDAGIRRSRALGDALLAAGFDPRRLDELDPPPARPPQDGNNSGAPAKLSAGTAPK